MAAEFSSGCNFEPEKLVLKLKVTLAADKDAIDPVVQSIMDVVRNTNCATGKEDAYTLAVIANFAADYVRDEAWTSAAINVLAAKATEDQKTAYWKQEGETPTSARET